MRIAIFDNFVVRNNPIGRCHRALMESICEIHDFTVFAVAFDNPRPDRIRFVRIPAVRRPLFMLFLSYQLMVRMAYLWHTWVLGHRFDLLQSSESKGLSAHVIYQHFCHRFYLRDLRFSLRPRAFAKYLDHILHTAIEGRYLRRASIVVVPSRGLQEDIVAIYGHDLERKVSVFSNPIDTAYFHVGKIADRDHHRARLGFLPEDLVLILTALGNFEHKGVPLLLRSVQELRDSRIRLLVVGGTPDLCQIYRRRALNLGLTNEQVIFTGLVEDVRPYLWAADVFCLPSRYETFSLAAYEAAACGLPLLVTPLHGVSELVRHGENGWVLPASVEIWTTQLKHCLIKKAELQMMGQRAAECARSFDYGQFATQWRELYRELTPKTTS